jgi:hypothetical protein
MGFRRFYARSSQGWQHIILVGASLSLTYLIALLTFMNQWINFWLRGSYFHSYQALFLTLLLIFFLVRLRRQPSGQLPGISTIVFGGAAGYVAGLIAFLLHPIFQDNGAHSSNGHVPISSARSGDCVFVVSRKTSELALRCHHGSGDGSH